MGSLTNRCSNDWLRYVIQVDAKECELSWQISVILYNKVLDQIKPPQHVGRTGYSQVFLIDVPHQQVDLSEKAILFTYWYAMNIGKCQQVSKRQVIANQECTSAQMYIKFLYSYQQKFLSTWVHYYYTCKAALISLVETFLNEETAHDNHSSNYIIMTTLSSSFSVAQQPFLYLSLLLLVVTQQFRSSLCTKILCNCLYTFDFLAIDLAYIKKTRTEL